MRRGRYLTLVAAVVTLGCTATDDVGGGSRSPSAEPDLPTLTVWADPSIAPALDEVVATFADAESVQVSVEVLDPAVIEEDLVAQGPFGQGPDVVVAPHTTLGYLIENGAVVPLDLADAAEGYPQVALDAVTFSGLGYGVPLTLDARALVRNRDLAPLAPTSWEDLQATGRAPGQEADLDRVTAFPLDPDGHPALDLFSLQSSFSVEVFAPDEGGGWDPSVLLLGDENGLAAADALGAWSAEGLLSTAVTPGVARDLFTEGQVVYWLTDLDGARAASAAGVDIGVSAVPSPTERLASPFVVVATVMVSNYSDSQDLAKALALTLTGAAVAEAVEDAGLVPARQAPSTDVALAAWRDVAAGGHAVPNVKEMDGVWPAWDQAVLDIVDGAPDPRQRWTTMTQDVARVLGAT